jgi:hypothetical protein
LLSQRLHYFGIESTSALAKYLDQRDDLHAGRTPRVRAEGLTIRDLCNHYLTSKKPQMESGELSPRSWRDYYRACGNLVNLLRKHRLVAELAPEDFSKLRFKLAKTRGPVALANEL